MNKHYETLDVQRLGTHVVQVTLNRPEVANALNTQMGHDMLDLFGNLYVDQQNIRCIILTGTGEKVFCAGGDLKERNGMTDTQWQQQHALFERMMLAMTDCPVPIIAAVNGAAYAGGLEMALATDFVYCASNARFALTEVTLGIMPGAMGTQNLPRAVGVRRAKEIILTGRPFTADEALDYGMVNRVFAKDALLPEAIATAEHIAGNAPISVRQAKKSVNMATQVDLKTGYAFEIEAYNRMVTTNDRQEGIRAFNEKRKPQYKGE